MKPTFVERLRAALQAFRDPEAVSPPLPELEVGLPPHLWAAPVYDHWHPGGRSLLGWLHLTRADNQVVGFTADVCPAYGASTHALELERLLSGEQAVRPVPVSAWRHVASRKRYGVLERATVQASTRPLEDGDEVFIYDGDMGRLWVRRPDEFLDGRFEPLNDQAQALATQGRPEEAGDDARPD